MRLMQACRTLALAGFALLALAAARPALADPTFPKLTGRVVDDAHVLPAATVVDLTTKLQALEAKTSRQLVVVTVPSLQGYDIADYGYQLGRAWGIGQKGLNNGVLLVVAPTERKVRIEVGYGMEGVITDAFSSVVLQTQVLPKFKAGDLPGGVVAGTGALIEQMSADPSTAEQKLVQAAQQQASARQGGGNEGEPSVAAVFILLIFVFFILRGVFGRGRYAGAGWWWLPLLFGGGGGGRWRDDDGGGFGGGGGGGGFSGGGGSFGGGGSSGSW